MYADNIVVSEFGSSFTLKDDEGNSVECTTKLLGKHNIYNILAGACVGKILGFSFEEISKGISDIEPVEHRLNIINQALVLLLLMTHLIRIQLGQKQPLMY